MIKKQLINIQYSLNNDKNNNKAHNNDVSAKFFIFLSNNVDSGKIIVRKLMIKKSISN